VNLFKAGTGEQNFVHKEQVSQYSQPVIGSTSIAKKIGYFAAI
jgi:hypothetical protein